MKLKGYSGISGGFHHNGDGYTGAANRRVFIGYRDGYYLLVGCQFISGCPTELAADRIKHCPHRIDNLFLALSGITAIYSLSLSVGLQARACSKSNFPEVWAIVSKKNHKIR